MEGVLFTLGVMLVDLGSFANNMAFYSMIWHLPGWQALIVALSNSCYQVDIALPPSPRPPFARSSASRPPARPSN